MQTLVKIIKQSAVKRNLVFDINEVIQLRKEYQKEEKTESIQRKIIVA
jgi:replicative DNA helicase